MSRPVICIWCNLEICRLKTWRWPPKYYGKRIFLDQRQWDQKLFHTIFDHHSKEIVAVHYGCKEKYYRGTFDRGIVIPPALFDHHCPTCDEPFKKKHFVVNHKGSVIHRGCVSKPCALCHNIIGKLPHVILGDYSLHAICAAKFCSMPLTSDRNEIIRPYFAVADIDVFWPDQLTRVTACLYPYEFRATIIGLLMAIKHLNLSARVPTDIILMIMNFSVSPMSYPNQNGFEISKIPTLLGGSCHKCKAQRALTRFDNHCCTPGDCLTFSDSRCPNFHWVRYKLRSPQDCTEYRCGTDSMCRICKGPIRYTRISPIEWCQINGCKVQWPTKCGCGRPCFKTIDHMNLPIELKSDQCSLAKCRYLLTNQSCSCGEELYESGVSPYLCIVGECRAAVRQMVHDRVSSIRDYISQAILVFKS